MTVTGRAVAEEKSRKAFMLAEIYDAELAQGQKGKKLDSRPAGLVQSHKIFSSD